MSRESEIVELADELHRYYGVGGTCRRILRDARKAWEAAAKKPLVAEIGNLTQAYLDVCAERDALAAQIRRALGVHVADGNGYCISCADWSDGEPKDLVFPCTTAAALGVKP